MFLRKLYLGLAVVVCGIVFCVALIWFWPNHGLQAELHIDKDDIGIPGITKLYEARLVNRSGRPIRVTYCNYVDDTLTKGKSIPFRIERWNTVSNTWLTEIPYDERSFCKPYPLGVIRAKLTTGLLWPGEGISSDEEATAARGNFNIGDRVRFVILTGSGPMTEIATPEFVIDEHQSTDTEFRIKH